MHLEKVEISYQAHTILQDIVSIKRLPFSKGNQLNSYSGAIFFLNGDVGFSFAILADLYVRRNTLTLNLLL